jgi:hypothetical protein
LRQVQRQRRAADIEMLSDRGESYKLVCGHGAQSIRLADTSHPKS